MGNKKAIINRKEEKTERLKNKKATDNQRLLLSLVCSW